MTRDTLIKTLTDRKLAAPADKTKTGCVPCFGRAALCLHARRPAPKKEG